MGQLDDINSMASGALIGAYQPGDPYASLYGNGAYENAATNYFDATTRGMQQQQGLYGQNLQDIVAQGMDDYNPHLYGGVDTNAAFKNGVMKMNPQTGLLEWDDNAAQRYSTDPHTMKVLRDNMNEQNQRLQNNGDWQRVRAAQTAADQKMAAVQAERARTLGANQGFAQEMNRLEQQRAGYEKRTAPNLMQSYMDPALSNAGNAAMAAANSTAGGSLGQAGARRAAMTGFGQQAAAVIPQALAQQGSMDMQQRAANDAMAQQYNQLRAQGIQNQFANNMASGQQNFAQQMQSMAFQKAMEEAVHNRSMEGLNIAKDIAGSAMQGAGSMMAGYGGMVGAGNKKGG